MTNYEVANNHIFFNLLNSLTPGTQRFEPIRARFWSFVFVVLTIAAMVISQILAKRPLDGAIQVFLLLANIPNLDLILQARGYGFLAFCALACTLLTWQYFRRPSLVPFVGIPLMVWLGAWTVPPFVVFGAVLLLTLLVYSRDWRWLPAGTCTLVVILLSYWPVRTSLLEIARTYPAIWGKEFANWDAISDLLSSYVLFGMGSWFTLLVSALLVVGICLSRNRTAEEKASLCVGISVLFTFVICLKMETAAKRTVAYTVVPFAFVAATLLTNLFRKARLRSATATTTKAASRSLGLVAMSIIVLAAFAFALHLRKTFHFVPMEAWRETAHKIEHRFPKGTEIVAWFRPQWFKVYLSRDYPVVKTFDPRKFLAGKQIVVDSSFKLQQENAEQAAKARFPVQALPAGYQTETVPQRRGAMQKIYFSPAIQNLPENSPTGATQPRQER